MTKSALVQMSRLESREEDQHEIAGRSSIHVNRKTHTALGNVNTIPKRKYGTGHVVRTWRKNSVKHKKANQGIAKIRSCPDRDANCSNPLRNVTLSGIQKNISLEKHNEA